MRMSMRKGRGRRIRGMLGLLEEEIGKLIDQK
jgi:hypothetical protein